MRMIHQIHKNNIKLIAYKITYVVYFDYLSDFFTTLNTSKDKKSQISSQISELT